MNIQSRNKIDVQGGMSSMTDLVFLLLIFFIILSTLAKEGHNVELPSSKGAGPKASILTLSIDKDLKYYINDDMVPQDDLELRLKAIMETKQEDDRSLLLNIDKDVPTGNTVEMIGMAKVNDWKVVIASTKKQ